MSKTSKSIEVNTDGELLVIKLFGMGSIVRLANEMKSHQIASERVTLITHVSNKEAVELLGINAMYIDGNGLVPLGLSAIKMIRFWRNREKTVLDFERGSNLVGIFRVLLAGKSNALSYSISSGRTQGNHLQLKVVPYRSLFSLVGKPERSCEEAQQARNNVVLVNINSADYISERRFAIEKFFNLIKSLNAKLPEMQFILTGSRNEYKYVQELALKLSRESIVVKNVAGEWTLAKLTSQLKACRLFITNDSGPMHLGKYCGAPMVVIWGPTSPDLVGYANSEYVLNLKKNLDCQPCFIHPKSEIARSCAGKIDCLDQLDEKKMVMRILEFLDSTSTLPDKNIIMEPREE